MNDLGKTVVGFLGIAFGLLVLAFTGYQTWSLLFEVTGNAVMAAVGLIFFEGGLLYWWAVFQKSAEGTAQMALSVLMAGFGLLLVISATALHLGAIGGSVLGEHTGAQLIVLAAVVNLIGKFLYPLFSPATSEDIFIRSMEGTITKKAYKDAESKAERLAIGIADRIGDEIARRMEFKLLVNYGLDASAVTAMQTIQQPLITPPKEKDAKGRIGKAWAALTGNDDANNDNEENVIVQPVKRAIVTNDEDGHEEHTPLPDGEMLIPVTPHVNGNGVHPNE